MATGIPKRKIIRPVGHVSANTSEAGTAEVSLAYPGKIESSQVLGTEPARVVRIWSPPRLSVAASRLYFGDNLPILATLARDRAIVGQVRLAYIDPPFATSSVFQSRDQQDAYADLLAGPLYLEFLRQRLILIREILASDGSIYLHLDENMAFHAKVIMDEVFGAACYRNWITRKKCNPKNYTRRTYGNISDFILFYTKSDRYVWNRPYAEWTDARAHEEYAYVEKDTGRQYKKVPIHAPGVRNGQTGKEWRGMLPPPGKHWQYPPSVLDEMDARGEIYWSANGNPRRKIYLDDSEGIPLQDIWLDCKDAHNQNIRVTGYPTEKPSLLLQRIIVASSNPGDIVLDCFSGSGTTLQAASSLERRWIGVDNSQEAIRATLKRFIWGPQPMGDFVAGRKGAGGATDRQSGDAPLSLGLMWDGPEPAEPQPSLFRSVTDFELLADASIAESLEVDDLRIELIKRCR